MMRNNMNSEQVKACLQPENYPDYQTYNRITREIPHNFYISDRSNKTSIDGSNGSNMFNSKSKINNKKRFTCFGKNTTKTRKIPMSKNLNPINFNPSNSKFFCSSWSINGGNGNNPFLKACENNRFD